jgi:hypothetical protein
MTCNLAEVSFAKKNSIVRANNLHSVLRRFVTAENGAHRVPLQQIVSKSMFNRA